MDEALLSPNLWISEQITWISDGYGESQFPARSGGPAHALQRRKRGAQRALGFGRIGLGFALGDLLGCVGFSIESARHASFAGFGRSSTCLLRGSRRRWRSAGDEWKAPLATWLQQAQIVYLVGSLFVGIAYQPFVLMTIGLQCGLWSYLRRIDAPAGKWRKPLAARAASGELATDAPALH